MKDITHIRHDFQAVAWVMPQGWDLGVQRGQKLNFLNMVVWHIKLKGMISRPGYPKKVVGLKGQIPLDFFKSKPPIDFRRGLVTTGCQQHFKPEKSGDNRLSPAKSLLTTGCHQQKVC